MLDASHAYPSLFVVLTSCTTMEPCDAAWLRSQLWLLPASWMLEVRGTQLNMCLTNSNGCLCNGGPEKRGARSIQEPIRTLRPRLC